jgi:hypothetical protein
MKIQNLSNSALVSDLNAKKQKVGVQNSPSFGAGIVTLSRVNHGVHIANAVVEPFNRFILPSALPDIAAKMQGFKGGKVVSTFEQLAEKVNLFIPGAGAGKRFKQLADHLVENTNTKLSFPIASLAKGRQVHMFDFPMLLGAPFAGKKGYEHIIADGPSGTMGDVVKYYMSGKHEIKPTIIMGGDNVFRTPAQKLINFFVEAINNPNTKLALLGVRRTPAEAAGELGIMGVKNLKGMPNGIMGLTVLKEKPPLEEAQKLVVPGENNVVANTFATYISGDGMKAIMDKIKTTPGHKPVEFMKDPKNPEGAECYDYAHAVDWLHQEHGKLFGKSHSDSAIVNVVDRNDWSDVGDPKTLLEFRKEMGEGQWLGNFPKEYAKQVQQSIQETSRAGMNGSPEILLVSNPAEKPLTFADLKNVPSEKIRQKEFDGGTNVIVVDSHK